MESKKFVVAKRIYYIAILAIMLGVVLFSEYYTVEMTVNVWSIFQFLFWSAVVVVTVSWIFYNYMNHLQGKERRLSRYRVQGARILNFSFGFALCAVSFAYYTAKDFNPEFLHVFGKVLCFLPPLVMGCILVVKPKTSLLCSHGKCRKDSFKHSMEYLLFGIITGKNMVVTGFAVLVSVMPLIGFYFPRYLNICYYVFGVVTEITLGLGILYEICWGFMLAKKKPIYFAFLGVWAITIGIMSTINIFDESIPRFPFIFLFSVSIVATYFVYGSGFLVEDLKHSRIARNA